MKTLPSWSSWLFPRTHPPLRTRILRLGVAFLASAIVGVAFEVVALSLQAARSVVYPARTLTSVTPALYGLPYERVEFLSLDGLRLRGWFIPGGRKAVVLAHGHAANKSDMLEFAAFLHRKGSFSLLLFDFRATGESEGAQATLGYYEWQDVAGAIRYLKTRPEVDPRRMGALGASMGAAAVLLLGEEAHQLRAVVADSAFATGDSLVGRFDRWFLLPSLLFSATVPWAIEVYVGLKPQDVAPVRSVGKIAPTPVFIIHGEKDPGIPAADAVALYKAAGEPKELWLIPGVGHAGGFGEVREEYERRVLAFFRRYLGE